MTTPTRAARLVDACDQALGRLLAKELDRSGSDIFGELGETLFWLCALAEAKNRKNDTDIKGLIWARNRITHGVLVAAPVEWQRGSELPMVLPAVVGARSQYRWLARGQISLGPNDRPHKAQEAAYDQQIAGKPVIDSLRSALQKLR